MEAIGPFLFTDSFECRARRTVQRKAAEPKLCTQIARKHVHQRGVSAMGVVKHNLFEPACSNARAEVANHCKKRLRAQRECPRKSQMLVAFAIADRRQCID